ncbi:hypothetical protein MKW98_006221 [Papaver atlanticum]|uniref:Diacylglycerol O-acyltransferase n=1 Tax=Papaver atlanticum TaxID=357466 RepID=A0AAD4TIC1_9MAGN|nr:hypothetical protein MKW98_006221 [Papaver atlanticum]
MEERKLKGSICDEEQHQEEKEPVSPTGQYYNSKALCVSILAVLESEVPIDDSSALDLLKSVFLPINPRFSSIMVTDENGGKYWKKVNIKVEDHLNVPVIPNGLSFESHEEYFQEYLTKLALEQLPQCRPLWEMHIFKYPTTNAAGTIIFKLHHALGDGYSLMGALFSCLQRTDNPSLPLTLPKIRSPDYMKKSVVGLFSLFMNTVKDFAWSLAKSSVLEDDVTPIRSGTFGTEFKPVSITTVTFSLDQIKQIKAKLGGTITDVIASIIFYGTRQYMEASSKGSGIAHSTALVLVNTREITTYQTVQEMAKPDTKAPWGNNFGFIHVPIPEMSNAKTYDPIDDYVSKATKMITEKKNSLAVSLTGSLLEMVRRFKDSEVVAKYIHGISQKTSMVITNMIGPVEQVSLADHPVTGLYFMVVNVPQNLTITAVSYMGKLRITVGADKELINDKLFNRCMEDAFETIFNDAINATSS